MNGGMDELKTDFWASAPIRRAQIAGAFAGVVKKAIPTPRRAREGKGDARW